MNSIMNKIKQGFYKVKPYLLKFYPFLKVLIGFLVRILSFCKKVLGIFFGFMKDFYKIHSYKKIGPLILKSLKACKNFIVKYLIYLRFFNKKQPLKPVLKSGKRQFKKSFSLNQKALFLLKPIFYFIKLFSKIAFLQKREGQRVLKQTISNNFKADKKRLAKVFSVAFGQFGHSLQKRRKNLAAKLIFGAKNLILNTAHFFKGFSTKLLFSLRAFHQKLFKRRVFSFLKRAKKVLKLTFSLKRNLLLVKKSIFWSVKALISFSRRIFNATHKTFSVENIGEKQVKRGFFALLKSERFLKFIHKSFAKYWGFFESFSKKTYRILKRIISIFNVVKIAYSIRLRYTKKVLKSQSKSHKLSSSLRLKAVYKSQLYHVKLLAFFKSVVQIFKLPRINLRQLFRYKNILNKLSFFLQKLSVFLRIFIILPVLFSIKTVKFIKALYNFKLKHFKRSQISQKKLSLNWHQRIERLLTFKGNFIIKLLKANWIKRGYQVSIFLILSLTVFAFSKARIDWQQGKNFKLEFKNNNLAYSLLFKIKSIKSRNKAKALFLKRFSNLKELNGKTVIISDHFLKNSYPFALKGTALLVNASNPILNLSKAQFKKLFNGKIKNWGQLLKGKSQKIQFYADKNTAFLPHFSVKKISIEQIRKLISKNPNILAFVALKNLKPFDKTVMINYCWPSKTHILQKRYPLGSFYSFTVQKASFAFRQKLRRQFLSDYSSMLVGGDVIWDRGIEDKILLKGVPFLIKDLTNLFQTADLSAINLENPISKRGSKYNLNKGIFFRAKPKYLHLLHDMGINMVTLANNHMFDYGMTAALDTINYLNKEKIDHVGFGLDRREASKGKIYVIHGKKVRFIGLNTVYPINVDVRKNIPGIYMVQANNLKEEIKRAKKGVDYLIALVHSGREYVFDPHKSKKELYRSMIDYGVDLILGAHPHVIQVTEKYKNKMIFYSLGNMLFDQYRFKPTRDEMVVELNFYKGKLLNFYPHFFRTNSFFKPELVKGEKKLLLLSRIYGLDDDIKLRK